MAPSLRHLQRLLLQMLIQVAKRDKGKYDTAQPPKGKNMVGTSTRNKKTVAASIGKNVRATATNASVNI